MDPRTQKGGGESVGDDAVRKILLEIRFSAWLPCYHVHPLGVFFAFRVGIRAVGETGTM